MKKTRHSASPQSAKHHSKNKGEVRIIAGIWRGRKLPVLNGQGLRPTTDRIKETLFNWLMPHIVGARCLDCFAGSGSLGFEALSRQAGAVRFFELDKTVAKQLQQNLQRFEAGNGSLQQGDSLQLLAGGNPHAAYDLVFVDPPFQQGLLAPTIEALDNGNWLADNARIYIESEKQLGILPVPPHWQLLKEKIGGEVCFRLYRNGKQFVEE
ncbi:16S rRNA (guanine(966)-N(2))-methyltransferase RsmD [Chelonobacter oris]|uniref:16S rRNA (guanine(966)-N(2))-methyltransferase RsmD n=1 Tax=Chelonobacter oris TaxID=505317 RepID=UPI00244A31B1|nr:16S rRNA (guanine(966)-N(2))-methyltransferase RsmD [Chelonobacter oris]MDH2999545.1 16S rRNA (guanine(966)-N(2))-methyltransferase RsmD [Chelonobacter oris]